MSEQEDEDLEDYYSEYDSEGMDDFYDSMPSDEDYYEGGSYDYGGQYYPATQGCDPCPAGIAHEMLHAFGAPDLYCADVYGDNYGVSEELVNYYEEIQSNDLMFTNYDRITGDSYYDRISNDFTDLDAYYCGIIDRPAEADEWGLSPSEHEY